MRRQAAEFLHTAVSRQRSRLENEMTQPGMVGMLIFNQAGRQHDFRLDSTDGGGQFDRMSEAAFETGVAVGRAAGER